MVQTSAITGRTRLADDTGLQGVRVTTIGYGAEGTSDANGDFNVTGFITGTYRITPKKEGYTFSPPERVITIPGTTGSQDFTGIPLTGIPLPSLCPLFTDTFDTGADPSWVRAGGNWMAEDGEYRQKDITASDSYTWISGTSCQAGSITMRMKLNSSPGSEGYAYASGPVFHFASVNDLYLADLVGVANEARLFRRINGSWTKLAGVGFTVEKDRWYDLKLQVKGDHIEFYVDGTKRQEAFDSTVGGVFAGMRADGSLVSFDDVQLWCDDVRPSPAAPEVRITASAGDVVLTWPNITVDTNGQPITVSKYQVWRSGSPYLSLYGDGSLVIAQVPAPGDSSAEVSFVDHGAFEASSPDYFYSVSAMSSVCAESAASPGTGSFHYSLVPVMTLNGASH